MSDFNSIFAKFQNALKKQNKVYDVSNEFTKENSLRHMLEYMWGLEEFHECIRFDTESSLKNENVSQRLRKFGNKYFKKKILNSALLCYNKSIINAINPAVNASDSELSLAFGFANRSAALFEMHLYDLCLSDIRRAFEENYPIDLHHKLIKRELRCYFAENNFDSAKQTFQKYIINETYSCDKNLMESLKKMMSDFEKSFEKKNINEDNCKEEESICAKVNKITKVNQFFSSASNALEFTCSDKGRGFIAKRDIMPGEVLMQERAYSAVPLDKFLLTHCSYCLKRVKYALLPCTTCTNVIFCDETCRQEADNSFHKVECSILSTFLKLDMGKNTSIAFRIICQSDVKQLLNMFRVYEEECLTMAQNEIGLNADGLYVADHLIAALHLVTNRHLRSVADMFKRCAMALAILKLFVPVATYSDMGISLLDITNLSQEQLNLASLIFVLLMNLPCNAHSITEQSDLNSFDDIGSGAFLTFSLINHSCDPNMTRATFGIEMNGIATQLITAGSEIFDSYGPCFASEPISRMKNLETQYYFTCNCKACIEDWPEYDNLPTELYVKCPNCTSNFDLKLLKCSKCNMVANELKVFDGCKDIDFSTIIKDKFLMEEQYSTLYKTLMENSPTYDNVRSIIKIIVFVNRYCVLPTRIIISVQEFLKQCLDKI